MNKINMTGYSNNELSRIVFDTEALYRFINYPGTLKAILDDTYIYTKSQYDKLLLDITQLT